MSGTADTASADKKLLAVLAAMEYYLAEEAMGALIDTTPAAKSGWSLAPWRGRQGIVGGLQQLRPQSHDPNPSRLNPWRTA
ncbi:MAG: hypothetical protein FJ317_05380 [SAR202 cluster bacterium]|nr:hypothetical protein [SAR202 cluster bacterium]